MGIVNNQGVFIAPPLGEGEETTLTSFREDDDFSTELFDESIVLPSFPNNVGIAFVRSSDSPADFATISLLGNNTSTVYVENTAGSANLAVSNDVYVGYKAISSGISSTGISGNLYVNGFIFGQFQDIRLRGRTRFGLNTIEINEDDNSITGIESLNVLNSVGIGTTNLTSALTVVGTVDATAFMGDGSGLTNLIGVGSGVEVQENGSPVGTAATINFGSNLDVSFSGGVATILAGISTDSEKLDGELPNYYLDYNNFNNAPINLSDFNNDVGFITSFTDTNYWVKTSAGIHTLSNVGIGTTVPEYTLDVRGDTNISGNLSVVGVSTLNLSKSSVLIFENTFEIGVTTTGVSTTALTTISSLDSSLYRSARFQVQIEQGSDYQSTDIMAIHNGTTANLIEYGSISTNEYLGTFGVSMSGSNMILQILMNSGSSANVSVVHYALKTT